MTLPNRPAALLEEAKKMQRSIALLLFVLYLLFCVAHYFLAPEIAHIMIPISLATAIGAGAIAIFSPKIPLSMSHVVNASYALLILVNSIAHLYLSSRLEESTNIMLVLLASGAVFYSWRWFWAVLGMSFASWFWATRAMQHDYRWGHYLFALLLSACMASLYQRLRINAAWKLAESRYAEVERTYEVAEANIELQRSARKLKDQAKELEKQNEILAENVRLKDEVERISRHDLRTPLTSIISLAQIVREGGGLPPEHDASLQLIEQAGYRVLNMANLSLDLFKMEQGTYRLTPAAVDIRTVAERIVVDLQALLRTRDVRCQITADEQDTGPAFILGDELLCYSMFTNLLKNAVEASSKGGTVAVHIIAGERVELRIHNDQPIPSEIRDRFFQKYSTVGKKGGTGLGAYSARLMAVTQGGSIRAESSEEAGTTVVVELPRATAETQSAQANQVAASTWLLATADWPRRSILVVDDDANNRAILRHFLAHPRWTVEEAENGPLALEIFRNGAYDFVLCDIEMPVMDGFEVVSQMRRMESSENRARATVIALSSHDDALVTDRALKSGFDRYLAKPVSRRTLLEAIVGAAFLRTVTVDADVRHLIPTFLEKKKEELQSAAAMVAAQDQEGAQHEFHRLRGSFNMYGFSAAGALCAEMEELARTRQLARISEPLASLSDYLNQVDVHYSDEKAEAERQ